FHDGRGAAATRDRIGGGILTGRSAAHDDDIVFLCRGIYSGHRGRLLQVSLDLSRRSSLGLGGGFVATGTGPPLPARRPALIEHDLHVGRPAPLRLGSALPARGPRPQVVLVVDQFLDPPEYVLFGHADHATTRRPITSSFSGPQ